MPPVVAVVDLCCMFDHALEDGARSWPKSAKRVQDKWLALKVPACIAALLFVFLVLLALLCVEGASLRVALKRIANPEVKRKRPPTLTDT